VRLDGVDDAARVAGDDRALLRELVRQAAEAAGTRYALLGRLDDRARRVESLAMWADGEFRDLSYDVAGTPSANVADEGMCVYIHGVTGLFPDDELLVGLGIDGYAEMPVRDTMSRPRAVLAVFDTEPLDGPRVLPTLRVFAARVRAELERLDAEERDSAALDTASRSEAVLRAVAQVAELLLASENWEAVADDALRLLGRAADSSRAFIFAIAHEPDDVVTRMTNEWVADGVTPSISNPAWQALREPADDLERLRRGEVLRFRTREMPSPLREVMEREGIVTCCSVPIRVDERLWGYLGFDEIRGDREWDAEVEALRAAAGTVGAAIARAGGRHTLLARERILGAVAEAAERLLGAESWRDAIEEVLGLIGTAVGVDRADLFECRVEGAAVVSTLTAEWTAEGVGSSKTEAWTDVREAPEHAALLLRGHAVHPRIDELDGILREQMALEGSAAFLSVPFFVGGELAGYVGFDDTTGRHTFSAGEEDALRAAASIVGAAIDREHGLRREHASERILAAVASAAALLLDAPSWRDVVEEVMALLGTAAGASRAYLNEAWLDGETLISNLAYQWAAPGVTPYHKELWTAFETRSGLAAPLLRGELVQVRAEELEGVVREKVDIEGMRSDISVPIFASGTIVSYLGLDDVTGAHARWSPAEEEALRAAAGVLGTAIERDHSTAALRVRDRILTAVASASQKLLVEPSLAVAIEPILAELGSATGASRAFFADIDEDTDGSCVCVSIAEWVADGHEHLRGHELLERLPISTERLAEYRAGRPRQVLTKNMEPGAGEPLGSVGVKSSVAVPVMVKGKPRALLGFNDCSAERLWADAEIEALGIAAGALAAAIERSLADDEARDTEARLWQAQKMEAVGRLAGGVAHDLNNYLTAIVGYAEFLRSELPLAARDDADALLAVAERVRQLVRRLLSLSRPVEPIDVEPVDVGEAVRGVEGVIRALAGDDVRVELDVPSAVPPVVIATDEVERIVVNLALNARDAMPDGGRLTIAVRADGDAVRVSLADTGDGMDEETRARSFDPFFTTKGQHGSGLGLSTVYGIVTRRGGEVEVETSAGAGTTVTVSLPHAT